MTATLVIADGDSLRHKWRWFLALGIVLILLGTIALVIMPAATLATVLVLGWLMVFSGLFEAIHAFQVRGWRGVLLHLVCRLLLEKKKQPSSSQHHRSRPPHSAAAQH